MIGFSAFVIIMDEIIHAKRHRERDKSGGGTH